MSIAIGNIEKVCNKTYAAGIMQKIWITCFCAIQDILAPTADHTVTDDIVMTAADAGATPPVEAGIFCQWDISSKEQVFKSVQDPDSKTWNTEFQFYIPGVEGKKSAVIENTGSETEVAIVPDLNGQKRIVGDPENPCDVSFESSTTDKNGYMVKGTWRSSYEPYFYTGAVTI